MRKLSKRKESMDFIKRGGTFRQVDDEGKLWEEIEFDGYPYMVSKIDTSHFMMIPKTAFENRGKMGRPATYHVSEFNHMPEFYSNLRQWLKGGEMIGGKSFDESVKRKTTSKRKKIKESIDADRAIELVYEFARENEIDEFDLAQGMSVFVHDFMSRDVMPLSYHLSNVLEYRPGISGESYEELDLSAQMVYDELVTIFGYEHYLEKENKDTVLTIDEEVTVGDYILEKGDRIRVLNEELTSDVVDYYQFAASALINGDYSGLEDEDEEMVNAFESWIKKEYGPEAHVADVSEQSHFGKPDMFLPPEAGKLAGDMVEYTILYRE